MKLLVDMFACQTGSRLRGIGRYALSLVRELAQLREKNEITVIANSLYPDSFEKLRQEFAHLLPPGSFKPYFHPRKAELENNLALHEIISQTLVRQAYEVISPDVVLYPSIFEGWYEEGVVPIPFNHFPSAKRVAIIYDFIPYLFADHYLDNNPEYKEWYLKRLDCLKEFDLLLSISESTRQDAIKLLGINPEKVINISGAASPMFKKQIYSDDQREAILSRLQINKPFIFYNGNEEYHKNINVALEAYSALPKNLRKTHQLVFTHSGNMTALRQKAYSYGLKDEDLIVTGHISDEDLIALYNFCKLFIFPSLYEGFGLPVLEAMACGAPALASNSSSIPEVVGREDVLFDASDVRTITANLEHVLEDDKFRGELSEYGLKRCRSFSWERSAKTAWAAVRALSHPPTTENTSPSFLSARKRIAFVSPIPPQKSGIADYSAELLPYLKKHYDIDLFVVPGVKITDETILNNFQIYSWEELPQRYTSYHTCVYQVGNSEFHKHMIDLIRNYPGVVVEHDFFLSNIPFVVDFFDNNPGHFSQEIEYSHGISGKIDHIKEGVNIARERWPMNWPVLRYAQSLIVHSEHFNELLERYCYLGWKPTPTVIKPLREEVAIISAEEKGSCRKSLLIEEDTFLVCSFGIVAPTKLNHLIIEAFSYFIKQTTPKALLVFVGEENTGEYGLELKSLIRKLGIEKYIRFTNFTSRQDYLKFLGVTDIAIQLRTNSRGETSAAVLDCLANGIPTIVNAHGAMNDYQDGDLIKLPDHFGIDELSDAIYHLYSDKDFRSGISRNARKMILEFHNPSKIAQQYAEVLEKAGNSREIGLFAPIVEAISSLNNQRDIIRLVAKNAAKNLNLRTQARVLIDVTDISQQDYGGGIQRVVKNWIIELFKQRNDMLQLELVCLSDRKLVRSCRFTENLFQLPANSLGSELPVVIRPGDILLMLDSSWSFYDQMVPVYQSVKEQGGKIITVVYDLIPIRFPETCHPYVLDVFEHWLVTAITHSDQMICISKAVADELAQYICENKEILDHPLDLSYVHLGADIREDQSDNPLPNRVQFLAGINEAFPVYIMVGTLEPRKGHSFVLDAFEKLWAQGGDHRLCILGKVGWNVDDIIQRISNHPELNKRLFFIEKPIDAEINYMYSNAKALISSSVTEGFGLPIIEAAFHQTPVIASDIPVFREIGGNWANYFSLESPNHLADVIMNSSLKTKEELMGGNCKIEILSWEKSARNLKQAILGLDIYKPLHPTKE